MAILKDASRASLATFLEDHVEPGSMVITDAWHGYTRLEELGYVHERRNQTAARAAGIDVATLLPAVHRVASLFKRWLLGTHQGSVSEEHLPRYLNEFVFRFNRRTARNRGLLFYRLLENAVRHVPLTNRDLVANAWVREDPEALVVWVALPRREGGAARLGPTHVLHHTALRRPPVVLVDLDVADRDEVAELLTEPWRLRAPRRLVRAWEACS